MPSCAAMLNLEGVSLSIDGRLLLQDLDEEIDGDRFTMVLGANGAGKTLFLRVCNGLIKPTAGRLRWVGHRPQQTLVFQQPVMLRRSVLQNVLYALSAQPYAERSKRARQALSWACLEDFADHEAGLLSLGQQQQLAIARAWALAPRLLLCDEPTASLDPAAAERIEGLIADIRDAGTKILMSTHNLAQVQRMADEVIFIHNGRINCRQGVTEFFQQPATVEAAAFLRREVPGFEVAV